uniref:Uncharacterized protein n=1 Tax=Picea glauca TaxID=3330 RepID=A0A101M2C4_PICGL|nr:hypothetical protein ABT39_MTgene2998 [Picea glauca]QHR91895.1 hypothetical protein Q903MT_gene5931 [Picea sitchensis]
MTVNSNYQMPVHSLLLRCRVLDNMRLVHSFYTNERCLVLKERICLPYMNYAW